MQRADANTAPAFTLVELVLVIAILAVLAAIAVPRLTNAARDARPAAFARTLETFATAALIYRHEHDAWPGDGDTGQPPAELIGRVDRFTWERETPAGGSWDTDPDFGGVYGVGVHNPTDLALLEEVDTLIDDGDLDTGQFRRLTSTRVYLVLGPN